MPAVVQLGHLNFVQPGSDIYLLRTHPTISRSWDRRKLGNTTENKLAQTISGSRDILTVSSNRFLATHNKLRLSNIRKYVACVRALSGK